MRTLSSLITAALLASAFPATSEAQTAREHTGVVQQRIDQLRQAGTAFRTVQLFTPLAHTPERDATWQDALDQATLLTVDKRAIGELLRTRPAYAALTIPAAAGPLTLDIEQVDPFTDDFSVVTASNGQSFAYAQGLHYRGAVHGVANSLVAISVFKDEVMGFVSTPAGDLTIGKLEGDANGTHILYRNSDFRQPPTGVCETPDDGHGYTPEQLQPQGDNRTVKCVRIYWEVNYDIFQGKGSVTNATDYVTGLFNQSAVLYNNDGISVSLSQVYVWNVASPYTSTSTSTLLDQFGSYRTSFNGDLANLLGYAGGGGIAWLSGLCNSSTSHKMAYSGISSSYNSVPTFSWSVEVVTHEQGHLMGSKHTHACAWNGNNTAIDGCGPTYNSGYAEGSCATGPIPSGGGTIMSYCHLLSVGINFNNGFGPQPTTIIVNNINNASCLTACSGTSCGTPGSLSAGGLTTTSATLTWGATSGATSYTLQWKPASGSTWTTVTGLASASYTLSGLTANTSYQFQVLAVCSGGSSPYSSTATFTTLSTSGCPDIQEPNNTTATAGTIASGTTYNAIIASASDPDYYKLVITATSNITVSLTNLPFDYDMQLLNSSGTQVAISQAGNTTSESITYTNAAAGTYYVYVYGYNGAFSTTNCYAVKATATAVSGCTDNYEPNETNATAHVIAATGSITGLIGSSADKDWFQFANTSAQRNIKVTLTNLPADYDLKLFRGSTYLTISQNTGTTNEQIIYNTTSIGTYKVKVYPKTTAFNASQCYTLTTQIGSAAFMPQALEGDDGAWKNDGTMIVIFPNPANDAVHIGVPPSDVETTIELIDGMGRTVMSMVQANASGQSNVIIDVSDQPNGVYLVRAVQGDRITVERLAVQR